MSRSEDITAASVIAREAWGGARAPWTLGHEASVASCNVDRLWCGGMGHTVPLEQGPGKSHLHAQAGRGAQKGHQDQASAPDLFCFSALILGLQECLVIMLRISPPQIPFIISPNPVSPGGPVLGPWTLQFFSQASRNLL